MIALLIPALFGYTERGLLATAGAETLDERLSLGISVVLILVYAANLAYTPVTPSRRLHHRREARTPTWSFLTSMAVLFGATAGVVWDAYLVSGALEDEGFYALALQAGHEPAAVVSSNPGQALWSGIIDRDKAQQTVERLMAEDMFNGWGIRTLSEKERRYNPIGYHLGTVWPHDNSIIAAGFRR